MRSLAAVLLSLATLAQPAKIFVFSQPFWINLHHFLYVLGRVENRAPDRARRAVANAPKDQDAGLQTLPVEEQSEWRAAVKAYADTWSKKDMVFDSDLYSLTQKLVRPSDADTAGVLQRAEPIYRKAWWPAHEKANATRIASLESLLEQHGPAVLQYILARYQEPWPANGYPVNVSAYSNWAGAYSTGDRLLVVSSLDTGTDGLSGLEIIFHEAMHQWDDAIITRLKAASDRTHKPVPDGLSHAMIFYTAGEAIRSVAPEYTPYAAANGVWDRGMTSLKSALDVAWKPYLDSRPAPAVRPAALDAALDRVLRQFN